MAEWSEIVEDGGGKSGIAILVASISGVVALVKERWWH